MKDFLKILGAVLAISLIRMAFGLYNYQAGIDDSNIYFVYVKNLYEGYGFVYNTDGPRVEGFTSFLWTLFLTLIYSIKFLPFETTVAICCFLITTATVFLYFRFIKTRYSEFHGWLMALFIILTPGFIDWNVFTLMDLPLWILAVSWGTLLLLEGGKNRSFLIIILLLPLIRPEGILFSVLLVVLKMFREYASGISIKKITRDNILFLLAAFLCIGAFTAFRLWYFGYPFPNTFYAKVSVSLASNIKNGFFYLYDTLRHTSLIPFVLFVISLAYILTRKYLQQWRTRSNVIVLLVIILFFLGYPFLTGGDHFKYSRFFQPVFPMTGLLFILLFNHRVSLKKPRQVLAAILVILLLNFNSTDDASFRENWSGAAASYFRKLSPDLVSASQLQSEFNIAVYGKRLAHHMNQVLSGCDTLPAYGVVAAGGTGYIYKGQIIDLMGLNNPEMAHADRVKSQGVKNHGSFDKKVFYKQNVDIFLTWPDPLTAEMEQTDTNAVVFLNKLRDPEYFINRVCKNIFNDPEFNNLYSFCRISDQKKHFYGFVRHEPFANRYPHLQVEKLGGKTN